MKLPEYDDTVVAKKHSSIEMMNYLSIIYSRDVTISILPRPIPIPQYRIGIAIGLMQKYPPIFKKMFLNDVALLWMRGFHAYDTGSVS